MRPFAFQSSSMVEHAAVNRVVVGSSPTSGAIFPKVRKVLLPVVFPIENSAAAPACLRPELEKCQLGFAVGNVFQLAVVQKPWRVTGLECNERHNFFGYGENCAPRAAANDELCIATAPDAPGAMR